MTTTNSGGRHHPYHSDLSLRHLISFGFVEGAASIQLHNYHNVAGGNDGEWQKVLNDQYGETIDFAVVQIWSPANFVAEIATLNNPILIIISIGTLVIRDELISMYC